MPVYHFDEIECSPWAPQSYPGAWRWRNKGSDKILLPSPANELLRTIHERVKILEEGKPYRLSSLPKYFDDILKQYRGKDVEDIAFETFEMDLQWLYRTFLKIFYPGVAFENYCTLRFVKPTSDEGIHMKRIDSIGLARWTYETHSTILILEDPLSNDAELTMLHYIGTLLHEMAHVAFRLNCCRCLNCSPTYNGKKVTSHGLFWQNLTYVTERFSREYLGLDIDCGRMEEMAAELDEACTVLHLDWKLRDELSFVHLDPDEVEESVRLRRKRGLHRSRKFVT